MRQLLAALYAGCGIGQTIDCIGPITEVNDEAEPAILQRANGIASRPTGAWRATAAPATPSRPTGLMWSIFWSYRSCSSRSAAPDPCLDASNAGLEPRMTRA
jgi:hypothetical protein